MNLAQIKVLTWVACGVVAGVVGWHGYQTSTKDRPQPSPEAAKRLLTSVEPPKQQKADVVAYARLKEVLADANLTGKVIVAAKPVEQGEPAKPSVVAVSELVRVQYVQVDLARPELGAAFLKY